MSVMVMIPTERTIHAKTAEAAFAICAHHAGGASFRTVQAHPIDRCRNLCAQAFLLSPHDHLLFIDSDIVPPAGCLEVMLEAHRPVVCGIYPLQLEQNLCASVARKIRQDTYGFFNDFPDEPFEADAAGLGCCLMARDVLERIEPPWFRFQPRPDGHQTGEDIYFFERCAEAGIRPLVLPELLCAHLRSVDLLPLFQETRALRRAAGAAQPA